MKKTAFLWFLALLLTAGCGRTEPLPDPEPSAQGEPPAGVILLCEKLENGSCLTLFDERISSDLTQPPEHRYSFCLTDPQRQETEILLQQTGTDPLYAPYSPAAAVANSLYFSSGTGLNRLSSNREQWSLSAVSETEGLVCSVSPADANYALAEQDSVAIYAETSQTVPLILHDLTGVSSMFWSEDGAQLAVVHQQNGSVFVSDKAMGNAFRYRADGESGPERMFDQLDAAAKAGVRLWQVDTLMDLGFEPAEIAAMTAEEVDRLLTADLDAAGKASYETAKAVPSSPAPEGWVEIVGARPMGELLLVEYLCESETVWILWDMEQNQQMQAVHTGGDAIILDICGSRVLYTVEDAGAPSLHLYDCAAEADRLLAEGDGNYTAGCFLTEDRILAGVYDPETTESRFLTLS